MSQYRYWKYGSIGTNREPINATVKDYINFIKNNSPELILPSSTGVHCTPQSYWLPQDSWSNTIVLKYQKNMEPLIYKLFTFIGITPDGTSLRPMNVSKGSKDILDEHDEAWVREYYCDDFELWDMINKEPNLFNFVI
jgi:hypothetical protein